METNSLQNLKELEPVPHRKTLILLNNFVVNTTRFLNSFLVLSDDKLSEVSDQVSRLETRLAILEAKLSSVPELEAATAAADTSAVPDVAATPPAANTAAPQPQNPPAQNGASAAEVKEQPAPVYTGPTVKEDPVYARYFKLLKLGMPVEQVKLKCQAEGNNPAVLDNPNAPLSSLQGAGSGDGGAVEASSTAVVVAQKTSPGTEPASQAIVPAGDDASNAEEANILLAKDDPMFKKFFKMVNLGIQPQAVKNKMIMEGVDPNILDNPNAPSPNA